MQQAERFIITDQTCTIGFREHVKLNICKPIEEQLIRRKLVSRSSYNKGNVEGIKKIIENNSSLRISFGWSFESAAQYRKMMDDCMEVVGPRYNMFLGTMMTDGRCDWLGFLPFNTFDKAMYEDLGIYGMIIFNNELIEFQTDVVRFISEYTLFKQHSLLRNSDYRFDYYKAIRTKPDDLFEAFHYYIDSVKDTVDLDLVPRQFIEEQIGCHYLYHPDIFFELLEFYKLKGVIYE